MEVFLFYHLTTICDFQKMLTLQFPDAHQQILDKHRGSLCLVDVDGDDEIVQKLTDALEFNTTVTRLDMHRTGGLPLQLSAVALQRIALACLLNSNIISVLSNVKSDSLSADCIPSFDLARQRCQVCQEISIACFLIVRLFCIFRPGKLARSTRPGWPSL